MAQRMMAAACLVWLLAAGAREKAPHLLVMVYPSETGEDQVVLTYDGGAPHSLVRRQAMELGRRVGSPVGPISFDDTKVSTGPQTSARFCLSGLVDWEKGTFRLEPIVGAFRRYPRIQVIFPLPPAFVFTGPTSFQTPDLAVRLEEGENAFTYHIQVRNPRLASFAIPRREAESESPQGMGEAPPEPQPAPAGFPWGPTVAVLAMVGLGGFLLLRRRRARI